MSPDPSTIASPEPPIVGGDKGVSSPASTVNVKMQLDGAPSSPDDTAGGEGGGHRITSGDEVEGVSDNDDDVAEVANRNGKRKRPISVS